VATNLSANPTNLLGLLVWGQISMDDTNTTHLGNSKGELFLCHSVHSSTENTARLHKKTKNESREPQRIQNKIKFYKMTCIKDVAIKLGMDAMWKMLVGIDTKRAKKKCNSAKLVPWDAM
jgi:hypothetical protein